MNQMNNALYVKPYDAGAASEGTSGHQRMVSRRRYTAPGRHMSKGQRRGNAHHRRRSEEAAPKQQAKWMQIFRRNVKWQKKQSTKQKRI